VAECIRRLYGKAAQDDAILAAFLLFLPVFHRGRKKRVGTRLLHYVLAVSSLKPTKKTETECQA
jgi:hypothetical protein